MISIRNLSLALVVVASLASCGETRHMSEEQPPFKTIVYHSSRCNGSCPKIDLQIDSNKNVLVSREFFKSKSETDSTRSGNFSGVLNTAQYDTLQSLLKRTDYKQLKFPDVTCCDGVVTTIIVYDNNNQRTYLKSMTPPEEAAPLIQFLRALGGDEQLKKTSQVPQFEE